MTVGAVAAPLDVQQKHLVGLFQFLVSLSCLQEKSSPSTPITTASVSRGLGIIELALAKTSVYVLLSHFFSQSIFLADHPTRSRFP